MFRRREYCLLSTILCSYGKTKALSETFLRLYSRRGNALHSDVLLMPALVGGRPRGGLAVGQGALPAVADDVLDPDRARALAEGRLGMDHGLAFEAKHSAMEGGRGWFQDRLYM